MTTVSTYQKYLVADMLTKRLERIGLAVMHIIFATDFDKRGTTGAQVDVSIDYRDAAGKWMSDEAREAKVNEWLTLYPDTTVERAAEYGGKPDMLARGATSVGIAWEVNFRSGVCERVQVGTRTEESYAPEQIANLEKVTIEVPVYEYVCPDPILAAVSA